MVWNDVLPLLINLAGIADSNPESENSGRTVELTTSSKLRQNNCI